MAPVAHAEGSRHAEDQMATTSANAARPGGVPTVAFDVIGTLFTLDRPRSALRDLGAPDLAVDLWIASTLRDYFAYSHAGGYEPLKDFLAAGLSRLVTKLGLPVGDDDQARVMETMTALSPAAGAREAVEVFAAAGWRIVAVTNGGESTTRQLLEGGGMAERFAGVFSCDALGTSKPHPRVYDMITDEAPADVWLVAAHAWDTAGARRAGLRTAWVGYLEQEYLAVYPRPDITAATLPEAAEQMIAASR